MRSKNQRKKYTNFIKIKPKLQDYDKKKNGYFFNLEKRNGQNNLCQKIKGSDGQFKYDIDSILDDQIKLYIKLFTSDGWDKNSSAKIN